MYAHYYKPAWIIKYGDDSSACMENGHMQLEKKITAYNNNCCLSIDHIVACPKGSREKFVGTSTKKVHIEDDIHA